MTAKEREGERYIEAMVSEFMIELRLNWTEAERSIFERFLSTVTRFDSNKNVPPYTNIC